MFCYEHLDMVVKNSSHYFFYIWFKNNLSTWSKSLRTRYLPIFIQMGYFPSKYYLKGVMRLLWLTPFCNAEKNLRGDKKQTNKKDKVEGSEMRDSQRVLFHQKIRFTKQEEDCFRISQHLPKQPDKLMMIFNQNIYLTWISSNLKAIVLLALSNIAMGT